MISTTFDSLFKTIAADNENTDATTKGSFNWYVEKVRSLTKPGGGKLTIENNGVIIGAMLLYQYDPKTKAKLPYWDKFPLVFPIELYRDGFLAINVHYLPPQYRAQLMDALYSTVSDKDNIDENTTLMISYKILNNASKFRYFKPTVHRYLFKHINSVVATIDPVNWDAALMLPLASFQKGAINTAWADSIDKIR